MWHAIAWVRIFVISISIDYNPRRCSRLSLISRLFPRDRIHEIFPPLIFIHFLKHRVRYDCSNATSFELRLSSSLNLNNSLLSCMMNAHVAFQVNARCTTLSDVPRGIEHTRHTSFTRDIQKIRWRRDIDKISISCSEKYIKIRIHEALPLPFSRILNTLSWFSVTIFCWLL